MRARRARDEQVSLRLTTLERVLAWRLALHPFCSRDEMIISGWGWDGLGTDGLSVCIHKLRRKLSACGLVIETVSRHGYRVIERDRLLDLLAVEVRTSRAWGGE